MLKNKDLFCYTWTSGFVKIANDIFDFPLEKL